MDDNDKIKQALCDPFEESDIRWRVQASALKSDGKPWVRVIPYVTGRAVQQRLDDVLGLDGWEDAYEETKSGKGYLCGLKIKFGDRWITKWDGCEYTNIEPLKGALSGALKRVASKAGGVGRYLYNFEEAYADCKLLPNRWEKSPNGIFISIKIMKNGKKVKGPDVEWFAPKLPEWALPSVQADTLIMAITKAKDIIVLRGAYQTAINYAKSFLRKDLMEDINKAMAKRKLELKIKSDSEDDKEVMVLSEWFERQVTDRILSAKNHSVLALTHQAIKTELKVKGLDKDIDIVPLVILLENYCKNQRITIKNGAKR